mgnify:CR=1 FL=1
MAQAMDEIKQYEKLFRGRKVLFIMPSLSTGGAERVMVTIIKHLNKAIFTPKLLVLNRGENDLDLAEIGCEVEVIDLRNNPGGLLTKAINITDFFLMLGA